MKPAIHKGLQRHLWFNVYPHSSVSTAPLQPSISPLPIAILATPQ